MPRVAVDASERMGLRIKPDVKARLIRAAAIRNTDLTNFVTDAALREADAVIDATETLHVSGRDSLRVLDLLENPPVANKRLKAAIAAMPRST